MAAQPATPQRSAPGGFYNTPAPVRQLSQQPQNQPVQRPTAAATAATSTSTAPVAAVPELTPIQRAARTINEALDRDRRYPELEKYVLQGLSNDYEDSSNPAWSPFQKLKSYELPDGILDQYNKGQYSTNLGLFANLNHAWMAVDNALYIWDYTHPNPDLVGYEDQPHPITAVKLVVPRAGVFVPIISHILIVATTSDIFIIGLSFERGPVGVHSLTLYQTNMRVPIRGQNVYTIEGSDKTGRVFFGGQNSDDVWELTYQQEEKWFANRCGKVNHVTKPFSSVLPSISLSFGGTSDKSIEHVQQMVIDDSRNLLYTLSSKSTIRVFHLKDNNVLNLSLTLSLQTIKTTVAHTSNTAELVAPAVEIVSIAAIPLAESIKLSLVATASTGHRIFLSANSGDIYSTTPGNTAPTHMQPHHVKAPPAGIKSARLNFRYGPGYFFCFYPWVEKKKDQKPILDTLLATAPESGRLATTTDQSQPLKHVESAQRLELGGVTADVGLVTAPSSATSTPEGYGNELAIQFDKPVTEVAILTNSGVHTVRRRRLVDVFAAIIRFGGTPDDGVSGELRKFARIYGRDESTATALAVACGQGSEVTMDLRVAKISDAEVLEQARKAFIEFGGKATVNENTVDQTTPTIENVRPSARHNGVAFYIARLMRSVWKSTILKENVTRQGIQYDPAVPLAKAQSIQRDLIQLKEFLDSNKTFIDGLAGPEALSRTTSKQEELALQGEHRALTSLVGLIANIIEGIAFVQMLFDEKVDEILMKLPDASREKARELTFEALFCKPEGRELAKELVKAIVNRNIENGSNVDTVAEALRRRCGSFCSADDVVIFKAQEQLKKASESGPDSDKARILLNDSLKLFGRVTGSLTMEHLHGAVQQYTQLGFYAGAIHLSLLVVQHLDPGRRALTWLRDGSHAQDPRKAQYDARTKCYELIKNVIIEADAVSSANPTSSDGQVTAIGRRCNEAYDEINRSDDEVFQNYLFDWYIGTGKVQSLLENTSPFVSTYLDRKSKVDLMHADILWKYYARHHEFFQAAKVQLELAKSDYVLSLQQRVEYLSKAKANASTRLPGVTDVRTSRNSRQELLREASDLLDIADIQAELIERLQDDPRFKEDQAKEAEKNQTVKDLNGPIRSLSDLFNTLVDPAGYWDICLLIYASADFRDAKSIQETWIRYIDQLHEDAQKGNWDIFPNSLRTIGRKLRSSESVLSTAFLLPQLIKYHKECAIPAPPNWIFELFLSLDVSHDRLINILEVLFFNDEPVWSARDFRKLVAIGLVHVLEQWYRDTSVGDEELFGNEGYAASVTELLRQVIASRVLDAARPEDNGVLNRAQSLREEVEKVLR